MKLKGVNKFYANLKVGVITTTPSAGYRPINTNLSYVDAMNYIGYYQEDGKSFEEALDLIERM